MVPDHILTVANLGAAIASLMAMLEDNEYKKKCETAIHHFEFVEPKTRKPDNELDDMIGRWCKDLQRLRSLPETKDPSGSFKTLLDDLVNLIGRAIALLQIQGPNSESLRSRAAAQKVVDSILAEAGRSDDDVAARLLKMAATIGNEFGVEVEEPKK